MEISDLTRDERMALLGLMEQIVVADHAASSDEAERITDVATALGEEDYQSCLNEVEERFSEAEALKGFLKTIERQEARELIVGTVLNVAMADTVSANEEHILDWVKREWQVEVK